MKTFPSRIIAENALRAARLDKLPVEFTTINGEVRPTLFCVFQKDVEFIIERGFDARLKVAA